MPVLKFFFNLSVAQKHFPNQRKQSVIVLVYKQGNKASVKNYRPVSLLNNFSKVFELIIHGHLFHYFKNKLNPSQHGFYQSKSMCMNLVSYLDFITPLVCAQCQVDAVYFSLTRSFDHVSHSLLLHKLSAYGLSDDCVSWLHSYIN
jgi:hypothetical protein